MFLLDPHVVSTSFAPAPRALYFWGLKVQFLGQSADPGLQLCGDGWLGWRPRGQTGEISMGKNMGNRSESWENQMIHRLILGETRGILQGCSNLIITYIYIYMYIIST